MVDDDGWEDNAAGTWAEESCWSQKREQEEELSKEFEKNVALTEESYNPDGNGDSQGTKHEYPSRPFAEDCPFYLRTGYCKFGFCCKFNHPVRGDFQGLKENERGGFVGQHLGQIQCKFYQSTGGCKHGEACRFKHSIEKSEESKGEGLMEKTVQIQCKFYQRTEGCKHGEACRFSHSTEKSENPLPFSGANGMKESKGGSLVEMTGLIGCKYHLSAGGCKYGNSCKFSHSKEKPQTYIKKSEKASPELNFLGLPIRVHEIECPFYMRNGSCAYGVDCRFNHPDPVADEGSDPFNEASDPASRSWSPDIISRKTVPNLDNHSFHPHWMLKSKFNSLQGSVYPQAKAELPLSSPALGNLTKTADTSTYHQFNEFPERPGEPLCDYFMKTGNCKYRSACKFHHPKNGDGKSPVCTW
ncbi:hypothetical protein WN944_010486 [Citrus x changshan-huyou]|uniref:Zinc finger CCCH domain-containing protein 43 n=2 Tax=Citrus TaxID=2706 RepID=A0ACB8N4G3_CITSI|nr:zinc finger CCCH domain-containing protein 43 [Citrus sinensis]